MSLATGNGNIFELTLLEHDQAKDQFSPVNAEGSDAHGINNCKYCFLNMRTFRWQMRAQKIYNL
jgi:hypothetical protein